MKNLYRGLLAAIGIVGLSSLSWGQCFNDPVSFSAGNGPSHVVAGDFNADGRPDLAVSNYNDFGTATVLLANSSGGFSPATSYDVASAPSNPISIAKGDFNSDGKLDLITANFGQNPNVYFKGSLSLLLGDGNGGFGNMVTFNEGTDPSFVDVGDFNGDGRPDLVLDNRSIRGDGGSIYILLGNGDGRFRRGPDLIGAGHFLSSVAVGDFNGDGKSDIATANRATNTVSVLLSNANAGFNKAIDFTVGDLPLSVLSGDFNGDGKPDLITSNNSGTVSTLLGSGDGGFGTATSTNTGHAPSGFVAGDFNSDGKLDLASTSDNNTISIQLGNGKGGFGNATRFNVTGGTSSIAVADFNADGKPDIVTANLYDKTVSILLNCPETSVTLALTLPTPTYDCTTGQLTLSTTGGNGQPIDYRIAGLRDWSANNTFTVPAYQRTNTSFTLEARQSGAVVSAPFSTTCQPVLPTAPATLTITSFTCNTTNSVLNSVNFVIGYTDGSFAPALPDLFINGVTDTGKLGQPYALTFDVNQSADAIQDQATRSTYFVWNFRQACALVGNQLLNLATPTFTCSTGLLTLTTTGGNGTPIEYRVAGLRDWASSNTFTVPAYQRSSTTFSLQARQKGQVVSVPFTATCPVSTRLASPETASPFAVVVYPNPVGEQFTVEVNGASGQLVRFHLTTLSGQTVLEQRVLVNSDAHTETLRLPASGAGLYLLQVSTDSQNRTLKVLKP